MAGFRVCVNRVYHGAIRRKKAPRRLRVGALPSFRLVIQIIPSLYLSKRNDQGIWKLVQMAGADLRHSQLRGLFTGSALASSRQVNCLRLYRAASLLRISLRIHLHGVILPHKKQNPKPFDLGFRTYTVRHLMECWVNHA